jgi:predicted PurR-regulated permease PerM
VATPAPPTPPRPARPPWLGRAIALFYVGLGVFLVAGWVLLRLRSLATLLLMSLVFSFALEPFVNKLEERFNIRRSLGTLVALGVATVLTATFALVMGQLVATQAADLIDQGPTYIEQARAWIEDTFDVDVNVDDIVAEFNEGGRLGDLASTIAPGLLAAGARVLSLLFQGLTVALFTFYLVADGPRLRRSICSVLPPERQVEILRVWELGIAKTGGYIFSRAVLALCSALVHWVAFTVIGVPSPLALAVWVGLISQFVPVIGTYIAGLLPFAIALANEPVSALWVTVTVLVYQQVENYLIAPRITAQTMNIHPAVAFGAVLAGSAVLGPIGALLALPLAATGTALASTYFLRHEVVDTRLTRRRSIRRRRATSDDAAPDREPARGDATDGA